MLARTTAWLMLLSITGSATADPAYHEYFMDTFTEYGQAVERCQAIRHESAAPPTEVLEKIKTKDPNNLRIFLFYQEFARQDECASQETAAMLYALGSLSRADDVPEETQKAVDALSENMFNGDHLTMEMRYRALPPEFRDGMEDIDYFHSPFSALRVLKELEK